MFLDDMFTLFIDKISSIHHGCLLSAAQPYIHDNSVPNVVPENCMLLIEINS